MSKKLREANAGIGTSHDLIFQDSKIKHPSKHDHKSESSLVLDKESGEVICNICGRVIANKELTIEQSTHGLDNLMVSNSRMYDKGLPTVIGSIHKDFDGRTLPADAKVKFGRLRLLDNRIKSESSPSAIVKPFLLLDGVKAKLAIPDHAAEKAVYLFRKFMTQPRQPRRYSSMMLASLYAACRITGTPRTIQEIAAASDVRKRMIVRDYRILVESLDLSFEPYKPSEFVTRICTGLGLTEKIRRHAVYILAKVKQDIFYGKSPMALAAAAVYISCKSNAERINQWKIASLVGISNVSLRNMYLLLMGNIV